MPIKRWLSMLAGVVGCVAALIYFRFSLFSIMGVFAVIVVSAALYHAG
jgi:hypothetical protein